MEDIQENENTLNKKFNDVHDCVKFYRIQSYQDLGQNQYKVDIFLDPSVHPSWIDPIDKAVNDINKAVPGIHLKVVGYLDTIVGSSLIRDTINLIHRSVREANSNIPDINLKVTGQLGKVESCHDTITIKGEKNVDEGTYTEGNVIRHNHCEITLNDHWSDDEKDGTALHEMLHAIGLEHEHQRHDAGKYVDIDECDVPDGEMDQYQPENDNYALSRFDPFSVMMYPCHRILIPKRGMDSIWDLKKTNEQCQELSELDKVGINMMIRPVLHSEYKPQLSNYTGFNYCGRALTSIKHSDIPEEIFPKTCGPEIGPNCPSCRVLETEKSEELLAIGKWQGWTGYVYCGKKDENGKIVCGLDNGIPCADCYEVLHPKKRRNILRSIKNWAMSAFNSLIQY